MEWHWLIDHCALVGCLLADEQSVYDPGFRPTASCSDSNVRPHIKVQAPS